MAQLPYTEPEHADPVTKTVYCVTQHEVVNERLGISPERQAHFDQLWERLHSHRDAGLLLEANALISTPIMVGRGGDALGICEPLLFSRLPCD